MSCLGTVVSSCMKLTISVHEGLGETLCNGDKDMSSEMSLQVRRSRSNSGEGRQSGLKEE